MIPAAHRPARAPKRRRPKMPVAHIEAGLRSPGFFYNPEEINRKVADACSELLFPHIREAYDALMMEGYSKDRVFLFGDIVKDSLIKIMEQKNIIIHKGNYILCTIHRAENTDSVERMTNIVNALIKCDKKVKFPLHPRTREYLKSYNLYDKLKEADNIEILPPQGFLEFVELMADCEKFITDSGSARREGYILKKPIIVPINLVWVQEMVDCGWSAIVDADEKKLIDAVHNHNPSIKNMPEIFGDGSAAERIIDKILERFS